MKLDADVDALTAVDLMAMILKALQARSFVARLDSFPANAAHGNGPRARGVETRSPS